MAEHRVVLIPDGLEGERVDAAVARMLGLSRSRTADLIARGHVVLDGEVQDQIHAERLVGQLPDAADLLAEDRRRAELCL